MTNQLDTHSIWRPSEIGASTRSQPIDVDLISEPHDTTELVDMHQSIAQVLATQGKWRLAYSHLTEALRLARDTQNVTPIIPEQYQRQVDELRRAHAEAVDASLRDALTASYNRRYLDQKLDVLLAEQPRDGKGIAVAIVDLDHFKQVNDTHGHVVGDRVLQQVVALLQADLPAGSFCARYGGEEFVLVLPEASPWLAVTTLERARVRVAEHNWSNIVRGLVVTISAGLVHRPGWELPRRDAEWQLRRADDLLYAAKRAGRNVVAYRRSGAIRIAGLDDNCR
ncbi:GGDEF domain-containing protein [Haloechinothrix halophila]|uniref:GGDEF domain-containing protein n=1 Tax=Haloechinothrix halophila TaxID=1069073 RepID=UPI0003F5BD0C|nr:GGDEF domain-containing protein [Haloechinothrix halophila]